MEIFTVENLFTLFTLTTLEIVLGIDNLVILALLITRLPKKIQAKARLIGLSLAMLFRILLLTTLSYIMGLKEALFAIAGHPISGKDIILFLGGLFLLYKALAEIAQLLKLFKNHGEKEISPKTQFITVIAQIVFIDLVFSIDSIITAIGITRELPIMILAILIAIMFMMVGITAVGSFIEKNPSIKVLALCFLILVGGVLISESFGYPIGHGYIYAAMGFATFVEFVNIQYRRKLHVRTAD